MAQISVEVLNSPYKRESLVAHRPTRHISIARYYPEGTVVLGGPVQALAE
jgi:hypothetical protein